MDKPSFEAPVDKNFGQRDIGLVLRHHDSKRRKTTFVFNTRICSEFQNRTDNLVKPFSNGHIKHGATFVFGSD
ncbi:MAG: hypothetical protein ABF380_14375 [Akkermansiaceae bacterium]